MPPVGPSCSVRLNPLSDRSIDRRPLSKPGSRHTGCCFNVLDSEQRRQRGMIEFRHHDCQEHSVMAAVRLSYSRP